MGPIKPTPHFSSRRNQVKLTMLLTEKSISMDMKGTDSSSVIRELGTLLAGLNKVKRSEDLVNALLDREQLSTTAIGHGVALPHAKTEVIEKLACCLGISPKGVDFKSNEPVNLIFAIVSPVSATDEHVQLLAAISRLCTDKKFLKELTAAPTAGDALRIIQKKELPKEITAGK
jgi:mannitol/fructose-specific phosphotransferase system IIA component (Ntr-type)